MEQLYRPDLQTTQHNRLYRITVLHGVNMLSLCIVWVKKFSFQYWQQSYASHVAKELKIAKCIQILNEVSNPISYFLKKIWRVK